MIKRVAITGRVPRLRMAIVILLTVITFMRHNVPDFSTPEMCQTMSGPFWLFSN